MATRCAGRIYFQYDHRGSPTIWSCIRQSRQRLSRRRYIFFIYLLKIAIM